MENKKYFEISDTSGDKIIVNKNEIIYVADREFYDEIKKTYHEYYIHFTSGKTIEINKEDYEKLKENLL